jgi:hypothetical protein
MNRNPGKVLLLLFCTFWLHAADFSYQFKVSNRQPYVKEPILLTLDINQTNKEKVLLFKFDLQKSPDYEFHRLFAKETDSYHAAKVHYEYLIYPLKSGKIELKSDLIQKATTDENLAYSFSGDRDNVKGLTTVDTKVSLAPLALQVKALPAETQLVGNFTLEHTLKKRKAEAYEPLPFTVTIEGVGYPPLLETLVPKKKDYTLFEEKPVVKSVNTPEGAKSTVIYIMALSHGSSFDLDPVKIKAFDPAGERSYMLSIPEQHFEISPADTKKLVDTTDDPKPLQTDLSWLTSLLGCLVVFFAGYLTALTWKWKRQVTTRNRDPLWEKVKACKEEKSLLQLLMAADSKRFEKAIAGLEKGIYGHTKSNFKQIKQEVLEQIE